MSEYITAQKGKLVSSSSENKKKKKKKKEIGGGCGGVFFQIFNGKRLFSWKSLPEARPLDHADEKRPIAKLLLNAEESVDRFQRPDSSQDDLFITQSKQDAVIIENEPDCLHSKKVPSLVARLMGLETMPSSPEALVMKTKEINVETNDIDCNPLCKGLEPIESSNINILHEQPMRPNPRRHAKEDRHETKILSTPNNSFSCVDKGKDGLYKSKGISRRPPHQLDSSFPSPSMPPKGDSTYNKRTTSRSPKMNETKMCQLAKRNRTENVVCLGRNVVLRPQNGVVSKAGKNKGHISGHTEQESKIRIRSRNGNNEMVSKTDRNKSLLHELQKRYKYQQELTKRINFELEKARLRCEPRDEIQRRISKQEETSRRLSQPSSRSIESNRLRHSSSFKSQLGSKNTFGLSKIRRSMPSSKTSELSRIVGSQVGSNAVPTDGLSISSVNGCLEQSEEGSNSVEQKRLSNKVLDECANGFDTASIDGYSNSEAVKCSQSSSTPMNNASEFIRNSKELSCFDDGDGNHVIGYERVQARWENDGSGNDKGLGAKRVLDFLKVEPSSCDSLFEESGDTGCSSREESDISSQTCDSVSYSEKNNVSAILHELLAALSSSKSGLEPPKKFSGNESKIMCLEMMPPQFVMDRHREEKTMGVNESLESSLHNLSIEVRDQELESPFEDSDCHNTLEYLGLKEVRKSRFNPSHSESLDCSITSMELTQGKDSNASELAVGITKMPVKEGHEYLSDTIIDCDALLNTISRLHSIDPEAIGLTPKASMYKNDTLICRRDEKAISFAPSIGQDLSFLQLGDKVQSSDQLFSLSSSISANDEGETNNSCTVTQDTCRYQEDAMAQNKKLISDCVSEAFQNMGKQMYDISSIINPCSPSLVLSKVYKQIDDWKRMSIGMNFDDMVEKEMNTNIGRWLGHHDLADEAEERVEVIESTIFDRLVEEFVLELI